MNYKHIHFIGVGGIGMSGLAYLARSHGIHVSGCDIDIDQDTITHIKNHGCLVYLNHGNNACFDPAIDLYVYSTRISPDVLEIIHAKNHDIKIMHRSELLASFLQEKIGIAITGTHGKTTTTSILAHLLICANIDPSVMVGGMVRSVGGNARFGHGPYFVVEADESDRSLLRLDTSIKLITTIDYEHPETYESLDDIQETFKKFALKANTQTLFVCIDDENILKLISSHSLPVITYSTKTKTASLYCTQIELKSNSSSFVVHSQYKKPFTINLPMPGLHNVSNCLGAIGISLHLGITHEEIQAALLTFREPERRFSIRGTTKKGSFIIDDYAHHPAELAALLKAARHFAQKKLTLVFQPHKFKRTKALWNDFVTVLGDTMVDAVYITDIYPAGEAPILGIDSMTLTNSIKKLHIKKDIEYLPIEKIAQIILEENGKEDTILFAGAGNIYQIGLQLVN